jgi:nucleoid-associated protein YgaU
VPERFAQNSHCSSLRQDYPAGRVQERTMALFDFFKRDKGKEVFQEQADAQTKAQAIRDEIQRLGLPGQITVNVEGSKVNVGGNVPDQATHDKLMMIIGNIKHIDAVDDSGLSGTQAHPKPQVHEVQSGDTLSSIAKKHYGDANAFTRIFEANRPMLKDPNKIYPGQVLLIPDAATAPA